MKAIHIVQLKKALGRMLAAITEVAQSAAEDVENLDKGKQNKITGTAGQVVGFDAKGNPTAQSADTLRGPTGATGAAAGFGTPAASVDANTGTPTVTVTASGPNTAKVFTFTFKNLKGAKGDKGDKGDTPPLNNTVTSTSTIQAATAAAVKTAYDLAASKQSKPLKGSFTIPASGWSSDSTVGYSKYIDIAVTGATAKDRADVIIAPGSVNAAAACGLCPVSETLAGKIRIRASKVPSAAIAAEYWIEKE